MATASTTQTAANRELVTDSIATGVVFALVLTVGQRAIGFVRGLLFCRLMTDQELGQWSMVWSFLMLMAPFAVLGLPGCFGKYTEFFRQRGQLGAFIRRISIVSAVLTLIVSGAIIVWPAKFAWITFRDEAQAPLMFAMGFCLIAVSVSNFLSTLMESLRQVRVVTVMRFVTGVLFAGVGTAMIFAWSEASVAATWAFLLSSLLGSIPAIWMLWRFRGTFADEGERLGHGELWRKIAPYATWLWLSNFFHNAFEVADRYMLIHWSRTTADLAQGYVGQYHSGRVIPLLMVSVAAMLAGVLLPYMSAHWENGERAKAGRQLNWTVKLTGFLFTAGGLLVILIAPTMFETVLQGRYNDGLAVLPLTLVYCIWFSQFSIGQNWLWVAEKGKYAAALIFFSLVSNVVINGLLIPIFGLWGAVMATTTANGLNAAGVLWLNHRFGCHCDKGLAMSSLLPLALLLPPIACAILLAGVALAGVRSSLLFGDDEKTQIAEFASGLREKLPF